MVKILTSSDEQAHGLVGRFPDLRSTGETRLRQCQLVMIRMLKILDFVCSKHNIDYWMTSGTLIGAIRHKGFIPWDCDIDVGISRDNLERLQQVKDEFPPDMFYQNSETDPYFPKDVLVEKLRDRYSNYTEWGQKNPDIKWHNGLQLDILIYDTDRNNYLINPYKKTKYSKDEIFPCTRLVFEGASLSAPNNYHSYIDRRYPNYMTLPSPANRIAHEGVADPFKACIHPASLCYG